MIYLSPTAQMVFLIVEENGIQLAMIYLHMYICALLPEIGFISTTILSCQHHRHRQQQIVRYMPVGNMLSTLKHDYI